MDINMQMESNTNSFKIIPSVYAKSVLGFKALRFKLRNN